MRPGPYRQRAFTLTELLIVVTILGILAMWALPQFMNASVSAKASSAMANLSSLRGQIELWRFEHGDLIPTLAQMQNGAKDWGVFTQTTNLSGAVDPGGSYGPYLREAPVNVFTESSLVVAAGAPVATAGWTYEETTGLLRIIVPPTIDPSKLWELVPNDYELAP